MQNRGITRPSSEKESRKHQDYMHHQGNGMSKEKRLEMLNMHYRQTLWVYWMLIILGVWILLSPLTFSYGKNIVQPSGGRSIWLSDEARVFLLTWSDIISGTLLIIFGWRSLTPNRPISRWITCFIGIWLSTAPLVFWAPSAVAYMNATFVGALVVALSILIPGMPNMIMYMKMGGDIPRGWSYNPSSWPQRWIMIVLGFMGWMVSRYLGAFQMGYIDQMWDPFFGIESHKVLNSNMSHSFPVSDGAFGAYAYTFEFLMGWMGATSRWRTMPWMVTFFGTMAILNRMLQRDKGKIILVGSALAYRGIPLQAPYCGAKHGIQGFFDSLRSELLHDKSGVKISMVELPALNTTQFGWVKSRLSKKAKPMGGIYQPEVAAKAIKYAATHDRREIFVAFPTFQSIIGNKFFPGLLDKVMAKTGFNGQQTDEPEDPNRPYNLWEPVPGNHSARGPFNQSAKSKSPMLWVSTHWRVVWILVIVLIIVLIWLIV